MRVIGRRFGALCLAAIAASPVLSADQDPGPRVLPSRRSSPPTTNPAVASPQNMPESAHRDRPDAPEGAPPTPLPEANQPSAAPALDASDIATNNVEKPAPKPANTSEEPIVPASPPLERFKPLWQNSPFSRNILPENKAVAAPAEFTLLGIGGLGDKWCALVLDKKSQPQRRLLLFDNADGDRLVKVNESPTLEQVTAEILVGGAPYVVRYDIAALKSQVATPGPGQAHVPAPAIRPVPGQVPPPQPQPPQPAVRVLPRRRYYPATPQR